VRTGRGILVRAAMARELALADLEGTIALNFGTNCLRAHSDVLFT
jgi:hypothetical protein